MQLRGARRRRSVDRGFVMSDHADWPGLLRAIEASGASCVYATHGYAAALSRYLCDRGLDARTFDTREFDAQYTGEQDAPAPSERPAPGEDARPTEVVADA
jgi:putative mRNA 3-end processing factor